MAPAAWLGRILATLRVWQALSLRRQAPSEALPPWGALTTANRTVEVPSHVSVGGSKYFFDSVITNSKESLVWRASQEGSTEVNFVVKSWRGISQKTCQRIEGTYTQALRKKLPEEFCGVVAVGKQEGMPFVVMPLFPFHLHDVFESEVDWYLAIRRSLLALAKLHLKGLIHGDVKSYNMMLTAKSEVRFIDLDYVDSDPSLGRGAGRTLVYSAPEGEVQLAHSPSDIYSFGATLFELYTEKDPETNIKYKLSGVQDTLQKVDLGELANKPETMRFIQGLVQEHPDYRPTALEALRDVFVHQKAPPACHAFLDFADGQSSWPGLSRFDECLVPSPPNNCNEFREICVSQGLQCGAGGVEALLRDNAAPAKKKALCDFIIAALFRRPLFNQLKQLLQEQVRVSRDDSGNTPLLISLAVHGHKKSADALLGALGLSALGTFDLTGLVGAPGHLRRPLDPSGPGTFDLLEKVRRLRMSHSYPALVLASGAPQKSVEEADAKTRVSEAEPITSPKFQQRVRGRGAVPAMLRSLRRPLLRANVVRLASAMTVGNLMGHCSRAKSVEGPE